MALPEEDAAEFADLEAALIEELAPVRALQAVLARRGAVAAWRLALADRLAAGTALGPRPNSAATGVPNEPEADRLAAFAQPGLGSNEPELGQRVRSASGARGLVPNEPRDASRGMALPGTGR